MKTNYFSALPAVGINGDRYHYVTGHLNNEKSIFTGPDAEAQARQHAADLNAAEWQRIQDAGPLTRYTAPGAFGIVTIDYDEAVRLCGQRAIWSDGRLTPPVHNVPPCGLSRNIRRLVRAAFRAGWRQSGRWQELLNVHDVTFEQVTGNANRFDGINGHSTNEVTLYRVTFADYPTLWLAAMAGGALGEDGDAWEDEMLFADEAAARTQYQDWRRL